MLLLEYCNNHIPFLYSFILSENSERNEKYCERILTASNKLLSTLKSGKFFYSSQHF